MYPCTSLSTVLTAVEAVSHKRVNNDQDVPSACHHTSICDTKRGVDGWPARKAIFALKLLGAIVQVHFHSFTKEISKELRQKPSESLLRSAES